MSHVYIGQLTCPAGHPVFQCFGVYERDEDAAALGLMMKGQMDRITALGGTDECEFCGPVELHLRIGQTRFSTLEELHLDMYHNGVRALEELQ